MYGSGRSAARSRTSHRIGVCSWETLQELYEFCAGVAARTAEPEQLDRLADHLHARWGPGHARAKPPAKLQKTLVSQQPQRTEHRIGVHAQNSCEVACRRQALARRRFT